MNNTLNLPATRVETLINMCRVRGTVYQADLVKAGYDLIQLLNSTRQLANCGLLLKYVDTRKGYSLSPAI